MDRKTTILLELHIRNFAIINDLHLLFHAGLNVLTGETGAGKSIIIDALGLLLGDRAASDLVRAGTERAEIEATFQLASPYDEGESGDLNGEIRASLETEGLENIDAPHILLLGREVRANGRNVCRVNGRAVTLQILSEIANRLVDIHGQGEHLSLTRAKTHVHLLDRYAGLLPLRRQVSEQVQALRAVRAELQRLRQDARTIAQRMDMLSYQVEEIDAAQLRPGEEDGLVNERSRLGNAESLLQLSQAAQIILNEGDGEALGAVDLVGEAVGRLERLARIDASMQDTADLGQSLLEQLSDLARELQDYAENLEFNPERLAEVEERLALIHDLKRKYGDTVAEVVAFGEAARAELDELGNWEAKTAALEKEEEKLLHEIGRLGAQLSEQRAQAGEQMARQVETELSDLQMAHTRFSVSITQSEREDGACLPDGRRVSFDGNGVDQVEFLISANPGEPLKPMSKVASGGETARLMLALKSVLAHADATPTLIFDEIDQGIGGRVGAIVGQKLWHLTGQLSDPDDCGTTNGAIRHQVLCITHLPQLAAFGDQHMSVNKHVYDDNGQMRTGTEVRRLGTDERVVELMQMLGATTEAGRRSVEEMLADVEAVKEKARSGHS